jgi:hypothetical protein
MRDSSLKLQQHPHREARECQAPLAASHRSSHSTPFHVLRHTHILSLSHTHKCTCTHAESTRAGEGRGKDGGSKEGGEAWRIASAPKYTAAAPT